MTTAPHKPALFALHAMTPIRVLKLDLPTKKAQRGDLIRTTVISFEMEGPNDLLNLIDKTLLPMLYKAVETPLERERARQQALEGVEVVSHLPALWSTSIKWPLRLSAEYAGYTLTIDRGVGNHTTGGKAITSNVILREVAVKGLEVTCKEGGTIKLRGRFLAGNMSDEDIGRVSHFIKRETSITLTPPDVKQAVIDGTTAAFDAETKGKDDGPVLDPDLEKGAPKAKAAAGAGARAKGGRKGGAAGTTAH